MKVTFGTRPCWHYWIIVSNFWEFSTEDIHLRSFVRSHAWSTLLQYFYAWQVCFQVFRGGDGFGSSSCIFCILLCSRSVVPEEALSGWKLALQASHDACTWRNVLIVIVSDRVDCSAFRVFLKWLAVTSSSDECTQLSQPLFLIVEIATRLACWWPVAISKRSWREHNLPLQSQENTEQRLEHQCGAVTTLDAHTPTRTSTGAHTKYI